MSAMAIEAATGWTGTSRASPHAEASKAARCGRPRSARSTVNVGLDLDEAQATRRVREVHARRVLHVVRAERIGIAQADVENGASADRAPCPRRRRTDARGGRRRDARDSPIATRGSVAASAESITSRRHRKPRGRRPLRHSMRVCASVNAPKGLAVHSVERSTRGAGDRWDAGPAAGAPRAMLRGISKVACSTSHAPSASGSASSRSRQGARRARTSTSAVPTEHVARPLAEVRHHLAREQARGSRAPPAAGSISTAFTMKLMPSTPIDSQRLIACDDPPGIADGDTVGNRRRSPGLPAVARAGAARGCRATGRRASGTPRGSRGGARSRG